MNIGDLFLALRADGARLGPDVQKAAQDAGDAGGATLGARLAAGAKTALKAGIGAALGVGFSIAAKGARELDDATQRLIADTGLTGDAAAKAKDQLASLYRDNLQGFDEIGQTLAKVHTDMGVTGDAAKALTQDFLDFANATGQNATEAVKSFDDILDSWGLTAQDATGLMDKLIVSHQRYGGEIADNETTLAALAPAMKAANLEIDDGIALLGLFGSKGLDAITASAAFAKALTKVHSPAELKALIADIEATTDPFQRAAKAADLFGARAGAKLANALGGSNLDDYKISIDEAAGATTKASDVVKNSLGNQFALIVKNAGGALAEFGSSFGPLIIGISTLSGTKGFALIGATLGTLVKGVIPAARGAIGLLRLSFIDAGIAAVTFDGEVAAAGVAAAGAGEAAAAGAAATSKGWLAVLGPIGAVVAAALVLKQVQDAIFGSTEDQVKNLVKETYKAQVAAGDIAGALKTAADYQKAFGENIATSTGVVIAGLQEAEDGLDADRAAFVAQAAAVKAASDAQAKAATDAANRADTEHDRLAAAVKAGKALIDQNLADGPSPEKTREAWARSMMIAAEGIKPTIVKIAKGQGELTDEAFVAGLESGQSEIDTGWKSIIERLQHPGARAKQIAHDIGILTSKAMRDALTSKDPETSAAARHEVDLITAELTSLDPSAKEAGKKGMEALRKAMHDENPDVRKAASDIYAIIESNINQPSEAYKWGLSLAQQAALGLGSKASIAGIEHKAEALMAAAMHVITGTPAPKPKSGGKDEGVGKHAAGGFAAAGKLAIFGEKGPEIGVPRVGMDIIPADITREILNGGATTNNRYDLKVVAPDEARNPFEIARAFARRQRFLNLTTASRRTARAAPGAA